MNPSMLKKHTHIGLFPNKTVLANQEICILEVWHLTLLVSPEKKKVLFPGYQTDLLALGILGH